MAAASSSRQKWCVIGGEGRGGVMVREGVDFSAPKCEERLSTGAILEELELVNERLKYRRLTGTGPEIGWITVYLEHKELAVRIHDTEGPPAAEQADGSAEELLALENDGEEDADPVEEEKEEAWEIEADGQNLILLPKQIDEDLKSFIINQIWRRANGKFAKLAKTDKDRDDRLANAQYCAERMNVHLRAIEETRTLSRRTMRQIKQQAEVVGDAAVKAVVTGKWLLAAQAKAIEHPDQISSDLWSALVVALRSAGVLVFFTCMSSLNTLSPHQDDFEFRWGQLTRGRG